MIADNTFRTWLDADSSDNFLWLHGGPGSGKTILMACAIEYIMEAQKTTNSYPLLYFLCNKKGNDQEKTQVASIIRSLLFQMWKITETNSAVLGLWRAAFETSGRDHACDVPKMLELLRNVTIHLPKVYAVIDAVDECDEPVSLIKELLELHRDMGGKIKLLVSSRPQRYMYRFLEALPAIRVSEQKTKTDVDRFVREAVEDATRIGSIRAGDQLKEEIIRALITKATGMYVHPLIMSHALLIGFSGSRSKSKASHYSTFKTRDISEMHSKLFQMGWVRRTRPASLSSMERPRSRESWHREFSDG